MTKVTKIIGSLVAVSALWLGGTAYISSNTKSYLDAYIKNTNKLYEANGITMSVEQFEKGFFSSDAKVKIDFTDAQTRAIITETLKLPMSMDYHLENGPIFFENGLGFGLSRIQNSMNIADYYVDASPIKEVLKSDIVFTSSTTVDFRNNASFEGSTNKIMIDLEGETLELSPLLVAGNMHVETFKGKMNMKVDSMSVGKDEVSFKAENIELVVDLKKVFDNGFYLGDFVFDLGNINSKEGTFPFALKDAKLNFKMNIAKNEKGTIDVDFKILGDAGASKLPEAFAFLKEAEVNYNLHGMKLDGVLAFQDYTKTLQAKQEEMMMRLQSSSAGELDMEVLAELEKMQVEMAENMMLLMAGLLESNSTSLAFETNLLDKKDKKSSIKMNLGYVGKDALPSDAKALEAKFKKELLSLLTLDFDVSLEKDYIANLPVELQQELASQLQMGAMFGIVKENNSSFSLNVNYKPKTLMLNGTDRSEMLPMIEMGLAGDTLPLF